MKPELIARTAEATKQPAYCRLLKSLVNCIFLCTITLLLPGCGDRTNTTEQTEGYPAPPPTRTIAQEERAETPIVPTASDPGHMSDEILPNFQNVAAERGINFQFYSDTKPDRYLLPEVMGGGAGWIDFDLDNRPDLYLVNGSNLQPESSPPSPHRNALFRQSHQGQFTKVPSHSHCDVPRYGQGCAVGDFNADGFPDLFLANYGPDILLMNNGDGTFLDVSELAGISDPDWSTSTLWVDLDADLDLDLVVVNYLAVTPENNEVCFYGDIKGYCGPGRYDGVADRVYLNQADGTFIESANALGFNPFPGKGLAVVATDFNLDLQPEIYVANDMTANFLYTRRKDAPDGKLFEEIAAAAGCAVSGEGMNEASMGISCADFDRNGLNDIYLTHYYQMKNTLYRNLGELLFEDDSWRTGVAAQTFSYLGFGTFPLDYNGDGAPDLFVTNGHVLGAAIQPHAMTPQLFQNDGKGNFTDVSGRAGEYFRMTWLGRGVAAADFDNDGDTDLAVTHIDQPAALLENRTATQKSFIGITLASNSRASSICARVTVKSGDSEAMQVQNAGGSYLSSSDGRMIFPVSDRQNIIEVQWPSGRTDSFRELTPNAYWMILEGRGPMSIPL
jgi:hypothetical protein